MTDPFPASDFDRWADTYDLSTHTESTFPFAGYEQALETVVRQADVRPGMKVLDIGTGTGNLAMRFAEMGCELWCTDFSKSMLEKARAKLPEAHYFLHDFRNDLPSELAGERFDAVVSAYAFHHVELARKLEICKTLVMDDLVSGGKLVIADLSFQNKIMMDAFASSIPRLWEEELYWLVEEAVPALENSGLTVTYNQVSACAGVFTIHG